MSSEPLILGIETSCDETGVGIVRGQTLLADAIAARIASLPKLEAGSEGSEDPAPG